MTGERLLPAIGKRCRAGGIWTPPEHVELKIEPWGRGAIRVSWTDREMVRHSIVFEIRDLEMVLLELFAGGKT